MTHNDAAECRRPGIVSVWIGTFPSVEAAETYFGIPDEIGVYLPAEGFAHDLGMPDLPSDSLEVNFEEVSPRPLGELLNDATFSASFMERVLAVASQQGLAAAQGIALVYDFDYEAAPHRQRTTGPMQFIGSFPFVGAASEQQPSAVPDSRLEVLGPMDYVL